MDVGNSHSGKIGQCSIETECSAKSLWMKSSCIEFERVPKNSVFIPSWDKTEHELDAFPPLLYERFGILFGIRVTIFKCENCVNRLFELKWPR